MIPWLSQLMTKALNMHSTLKMKHLHGALGRRNIITICGNISRPQMLYTTRMTSDKGSTNYELRDGILYNAKLNTPVLLTPEDLTVVIEAVHKDLGHYGKRTTVEAAVRARYDVGSDLWEEGEKVLDSCVLYQLYKQPSKTADNVTIHPYGVKDPFQLWEIDFVRRLIETHTGNRYIITAINY